MRDSAPSLDLVAHLIPGAEGPCVLKDGRVLVVSPNRGSILQVLPSGENREVANTGGVPAGLQLDVDGTLLVADMKRGIVRVTMSGQISQEVSEFDGQFLRGCNDLSFDFHGNLYFTAPAGSSQEKPCGEVFCRLRDGQVKRLDDGFAFSNGIAVSSDEQTLIVAETFTKRLMAYRLTSPGTVSGKRLFATLPGDHRGGPDGIDFDYEGNLLAMNWGGSSCDVFDSDGILIRRIKFPFEKPSNLHFGGKDSTFLLVTEHDSDSVWRFDYGTKGQCQYGWT